VPRRRPRGIPDRDVRTGLALGNGSGLPDPIPGSAEGRGNDPRRTSWPGHAAAGTSNVCDYARRRCQARTTPQAMKDKGHRLRVPSPAGCPAVR